MTDLVHWHVFFSLILCAGTGFVVDGTCVSCETGNCGGDALSSGLSSSVDDRTDCSWSCADDPESQMTKFLGDGSKSVLSRGMAAALELSPNLERIVQQLLTSQSTTEQVSDRGWLRHQM